MKTFRKMCKMMSVTVAVVLAGVCAVSAQVAKTADPFVKGNKPAPTGTEKVTAPSDSGREKILKKMEAIKIPEIDFRQANIQDVLKVLQEASVENDTTGAEGKNKGVTIILNLPPEAVGPAGGAVLPAAPVVPGEEALTVTPAAADVPPFASGVPLVTFTARDISLLEALKIVTRVAGLKYRIEGNVIFVEPMHANADKPSQIEVEVQFVAFDLTDVEKLAASGGVSASALTALWVNGHGHLLAAPKALTQSGSEATAKGVTEVIYPSTTAQSATDTTITNASAANTNSISDGTGGFETREVGAILTVMPEMTPDGAMINLTMTPQYVEAPIWHDYVSKYTDSNGREQQAHMEQPFFHTFTSSTSISVANGKRVLVGGGVSTRDGKQMVYTFVTARLVGSDGEYITAEDDAVNAGK